MIDTVQPPIQLHTKEETAEFLRVCTRTLHDLTKAKKIRSIKIGKSVRYSSTAIAEFIRSQEAASA